jgi:hypothetical protein
VARPHALLALALAACATRFAGEPARRDLSGCAAPQQPARRTGLIGVVADSQFNTLNPAGWNLWRRGPSDWLVDVAIRPPALDFTSHYLLRSILAKQVDAGAEVVFYLGDGANNGCQDELVGRADVDGIDGIFTVLRQARARYRIPIFFILGNHDYLGAGNTSAFLSTRQVLCNAKRAGRNAPLSKLDVMRLLHEFNAESAALDERWDYRDSWDARALARACNGGGRLRQRNQHLRRGCFLAGRLFDRRTRREYFLVDSNDYVDVPGGRLLAGRRGAVSFHDDEGSPSQVTWLVDHAEPDAGVRVILSHYDVATINAGDDRGPYHHRLRPLVRDRRTLWLSAHTHWPELRRADHRFGRRDQRVVALETNLGSTTDYPAYGLLTDIADDPARRAATFVAETEVFAITPDRCETVLADMSRVIAGADYFPFRRHTRGLGLFGLDFLVDFTLVKKEYRHRSWSADDDRHVRENIRTWLAAYAPGAAEGRQCGWPDDARLTAGACVAFYASLQEGVKHGWAPVTCDDCRPEQRPAPRAVSPLGSFRLRLVPGRE